MLCALNCFCVLHLVHRPSPLHLNIIVLHWSPLYVYTCLACVLPAIVRTIGTSRQPLVHFVSVLKPPARCHSAAMAQVLGAHGAAQVDARLAAMKAEFDVTVDCSEASRTQTRPLYWYCWRQSGRQTALLSSSLQPRSGPRRCRTCL